MPEQLRVTKAGALTEISQPPLSVTKMYVLTQVGESTVIAPRITKLYTLTEISERRMKLTKLYFLAQLRVVGPYPVKVKNNIDVTFDGSSIKSHIQTMSLQANVKDVDTTVLSSTDVSKIGVSTEWTLTLAGPWTPTLDDIFGAAISDEQTLVDCSVLLGQGLFQVGYEWTAAAFVAQYRVAPDIEGIIRYDATIKVNGAPTRSSTA